MLCYITYDVIYSRNSKNGCIQDVVLCIRIGYRPPRIYSRNSKNGCSIFHDV